MFLLLYVGIPIALIGPATFGMGLSFPWLQRAIQTDARWLGRRVGWLQTANIAGSLAGSLATGFVLLPLLGTSGTFRSLAAAALVFPLLALRASTRAVAVPIVGVALLAILAATLPDGRTLYARLHGVSREQILVAEDASGVSALAETAKPGVLSMTAGGTAISTIPYGVDSIHTLLGAVPVLLHPAPKRVAVIGLGSGDTLYAAACRPGIEEVAGIEIIGSQLDLLRAFQARGGDPGVGALLAHPTARIRIADGRTFVRRDRAPWDVIEADALRPTAAYSGNLYSHEYFEQIGASLAPGGLAVTWIPTTRVVDTLLSVYPHALLIGEIGIASRDPIACERTALLGAASDPAVRAHFERAGIDLPALLQELLDAGPIRVVGPNTPRRSSRDLNSDLFARDEFLVPRVPAPRDRG
jgi:predicted membrane-bound spermidine synthase